MFDRSFIISELTLKRAIYTLNGSIDQSITDGLSRRSFHFRLQCPPIKNFKFLWLYKYIINKSWLDYSSIPGVFPDCTRENLMIRLSPLVVPHLTQSTITPNNFSTTKIIIIYVVTTNVSRCCTCIYIPYHTLPGCAPQQNICPYIVCSRSKWEQHLQHLSALQWQFVWVGLTFLHSQ